ncbi:YggS family pyridoxal phosphate-dependent enzyme [Balneolales bacterium ANBcel1]|nr:YggS family pyridoxal phosphate-dependent enzyme [Balneolales bacterium ANBcel1]
MTQSNIRTLHEHIRQVCAACGRDPSEIRLVAVSKTHPEEAIMEAYHAGIRDFGENRVQELTAKMPLLPEDITWHMVGTVQTNKIKDMVDRVDWIHSMSKIKYLKELEKRAGRIGRTINVLIQVNISGEDQKSGCEPDALAEILDYTAGLKHVTVRGLMGMASFTDDRELIRRQFRTLRTLLQAHHPHESERIRLKELSMGMSGDYDIAIEEGATIIRVGSTIFGSRDYDN